MKSATPGTVSKAGQQVEYRFAVTNTGNVTLSGVTVKDTAFSGTGTLGAITCPESSLAPQASETCTADYTVTQADVDAGTITNTATVSGLPPKTSADPSPTAVTSQPSTAIDRVVLPAVGPTVGTGGVSQNTPGILSDLALIFSGLIGLFLVLGAWVIMLRRRRRFE